MKTPIASLEAGLAELAGVGTFGATHGCADQYGRLLYLASALVEGSTDEKKTARARLQSIIGRGRCLLNAAELEARQSDNAVTDPPWSTCLAMMGAQLSPDTVAAMDENEKGGRAA